MKKINTSKDIIHTRSLFEESDYVDENLVPKSSMAFTAVHMAADKDFVEIFRIGGSVDGVHHYEFRGLGTEYDATLSTASTLSTPKDIIAAVHFALQTRAQELTDTQ